MTDQRYLEDATVRTFEATVERALDDRIVLDGTHFYPTGGGQPHDTGRIGVDGDSWRVVDVEKKDAIYHRLEPVDGTAASTPTAGTTVTGHLDWDRRDAHMRYHTAQHLLSALLLEEFDAPTTGNQLYHDHAHLDCEYDRFDGAELSSIERRLNELVDEERPVRWYTMDRDRAEETLDTDRTRIDLLPDSIQELRIVEIGGERARAGGGAIDGPPADADRVPPYDRTACAGTHVKNTAEIGEIVVDGRETKGSNEERIQFVLADHDTGNAGE
ncbi:alanyl-tRNA editing protein [Halalkaliarchaeum sp. AArc-GB]|uniref:alanyl-tRNA editing protein n=1 Tax=Halalkaliarchaeum sp. AArc-GB TaxID=3074078 RepID=UPI0028548376|nr:alanyl-tRNA editing protein [Halalkaliarchaeum sp. AArc-GB]MDR5672260.1 alanyl-tRNA editing protein [Halalkaliarchaeum sp. AArc-GB]